MSDIYKKQVGGSHYQSMVIQPSEFINKNNLPFAEEPKEEKKQKSNSWGINK